MCVGIYVNMYACMYLHNGLRRIAKMYFAVS